MENRQWKAFLQPEIQPKFLWRVGVVLRHQPPRGMIKALAIRYISIVDVRSTRGAYATGINTDFQSW
jgi:hypothetical protein